MLRVILEVIPDNVTRQQKRGRVVRVIDIKEDRTGSYDFGNYKAKWSTSFETIGGDEAWRQKQATNVSYKDIHRSAFFERLLHQVLTTWLKDKDAGLLTINRQRRRAEPAEDASQDAEGE